MIFILNTASDLALTRKILSKAFNPDDPFDVSGEGYSLELCYSMINDLFHELTFYHATLEEIEERARHARELENARTLLEAQKILRTEDEHAMKDLKLTGAPKYLVYSRKQFRLKNKLQEDRHREMIQVMISQSNIPCLIETILRRIIRERIDSGYSLCVSINDHRYLICDTLLTMADDMPSHEKLCELIAMKSKFQRIKRLEDSTIVKLSRKPIEGRIDLVRNNADQLFNAFVPYFLHRDLSQAQDLFRCTHIIWYTSKEERKQNYPRRVSYETCLARNIKTLLTSTNLSLISSEPTILLFLFAKSSDDSMILHCLSIDVLNHITRMIIRSQ
ncbi:Hypothetical protein POVR1_LOCUS140 [uncultured virus]|nr:Hypothetical protein POVR1_LOCUS140 [uncultured virus]